MQLVNVELLVEGGLEFLKSLPEPFFVIDFFDSAECDVGDEIFFLRCQSKVVEQGVDFGVKLQELGSGFYSEPQDARSVVTAEDTEFVDLQIEGCGVGSNLVDAFDDAGNFVFRCFPDEADGEVRKVVGHPGDVIERGAAAELRAKGIVFSREGDGECEESSFHVDMNWGAKILSFG